MPKKPNTKMKELAAADFGTILQEGKIVKMRAGKATIEYTKTLRGKKKVTTYHIHLSPQIVHEEIPEEEVAVVRAARKPAAKKPGRKPGKVAKKPTAKKPGRKPKQPKQTATPEPESDTPKKRVRKIRIKKQNGNPTELPVATEAPEAPAKPEPEKKTKPAALPWSDLGDDDFAL